MLSTGVVHRDASVCFSVFVMLFSVHDLSDCSERCAGAHYELNVDFEDKAEQ